MVSLIPQASGIYMRTNPAGRVYIGQTIDLRKRMNQYPKKNQTVLYNSYKKYGKENHSFEVLELCEVCKLDEMEMHYISLYKSDIRNSPEGNGMNLTVGGDGHRRGTKTSEETKVKLSVAAIRAGCIPPSHIGFKRTDESKEKYRLSKIGNKNGVGNKNNLGKKASEETRQKLRNIWALRIKKRNLVCQSV
jgi:group I intron endonuclease